MSTFDDNGIEFDGNEIVLWAPHDGPQTNFLLSEAYEALYGGAAGGGKTDALLAWLIEDAEHPQYRGLFLRKTYAALKEVIDRTRQLWTKLGATWNEGKMTWSFPGGATIELGYLEVWADTERYQGRQWSRIAYDELGQLAEERCWTFLMSRNRSAVPGMFKGIRGSANPGGAGHAWIRRRFINCCPPDGTPIEIPDEETGDTLSRAFFQAFVEDNPTLLKNDPKYLLRLNLLPETQRKQLRAGDWSAGDGLALEELDEHRHRIKPFAIPKHWHQFGAFDWGFAHPFAFGWFAVDEEGNVYLVQTVLGWRMKPAQIAARILESVPVDDLTYIDAGHDCWAEIKARGEDTPTIAEQMQAFNIFMRPANVARKAGLNNLRNYLAWRGTVAVPDPNAPGDYSRMTYVDGEPRFYIMDTPNNRVTFDCLAGMVTDPLNREDALKKDADDDGQNGDDPYDMVRYGLASRPVTSPKVEPQQLGAWHPDILKAEADYKRTIRSRTDNPIGETNFKQLPPGSWEVF